jgi:hypothetical protein
MSDNKPTDSKLLHRNSRPTTIAGVFGNLFQIFGVRASDTDLIERWDEIIGDDIASIAKPVAIKKTVGNKYSIVIKPINPALSLQLSYNQDEILRRINKYFGYDAISKITFRK